MAIEIITTSSVTPDDYLLHKDTAIYPAFMDGLEYESWGSGTSISSSKTNYFQFKATGASNITWSSGVLPPGFQLSPQGRLSGTPLEEGTFTFSVTAESGSESDTRTLSMKIYPERSRWLRDARLGVTVHWGRFTDPAIKNSPYYDPGPNGGTGTTDFQARALTTMNASSWATQFCKWGAKFIEFSGIWQDSYRNWNSTTETRYEMHSTRDFVGEIVNAFHAEGLKVMSYYSPDFQNLPDYEHTSDADKYSHAWGGMNNGLVKELVLKGIDGLWVDIGGASSVYENEDQINPKWFYWDYLIPTMRYNNPFFIFGVNPGVFKGGTQVEFPYSDFVIYESVAADSTSATLLEKAVPVLSKKKMAIYVSNMLSKHFAWGANMGMAPIKDINGTIENLKLNWEAGATVSVALPVQTNGVLVHPHFEPIMTQIGLATKDKGSSADPTISYVGNTVNIAAPTLSRVFFTLDGTEPTLNSNIYVGPLTVARNTKLKIRTLEQAKYIGYVKELSIETFSPTGPNLKLFNLNDSDLNYVQTKKNYRGMKVTIGNAPVIIKAVGRKAVGASIQRSIIIRRFFDQYPVYSGMMDGSELIEDGYKFKNITEIRLERGMSYVICIQEDGAGDDNDTGPFEPYASNDFASIPFTQHIRIVEPFKLSALGDFFPIPTDNKGQILNLKYEVVKLERSSNLALGKPAKFLSNSSGGELGASAEKYFAINATDGNKDSVAKAGGEYPYTLQIDLLMPHKIDRITLDFTTENFATEFQVYASLNNSGGPNELISSISNNTARTFEFKFNSILARYVFVKATQPSVEGQTGGQMAVSAIGVFCDQGSNRNS
ncbi:Chitobiase/beta-hexosaminidase C-terminal domain-containing protein [Dyadobacter sp. SG02]|uniref:alpha-L-fucosidase n=1 Tax=Dyadobacter sp. SG02 TaxID=1855291 RepID=UPI0008C55E7D|nr:alpha-L-fucosidase [Dyadobacter sp. SG02]SEJ32723.1 Chitobiase/beta-hexosaminidase C-terminal domain-containing protein [Dyadobacter sp. SG02]